jgi:hypothetical protein
MVITLVGTAPARLLELLLPGDRVIVQGFHGTLWRGGASRALVQAGPGYLQLGAVDWRLSPLSLLTFRPRLALRSEWGRQRLAGELVLRGGSDLSVHDFSANLSAELVRHYLPVVLEGDIALQLATLQLRDGLPHRSDGRIVWQDAAWLSPAGIRPLGSYALEIEQPAGGDLDGQVITLSGPVEAAGSVQLSGLDYRLDILLGGGEPLDSQLRQALSLVAVQEGERFRVSLQGQL